MYRSLDAENDEDHLHPYLLVNTHVPEMTQIIYKHLGTIYAPQPGVILCTLMENPE